METEYINPSDPWKKLIFKKKRNKPNKTVIRENSEKENFLIEQFLKNKQIQKSLEKK